MPRISKIEAFFLRYSFPDHINYVYSGGVVGNMDVALIRVSTEDGEYGLGVAANHDEAQQTPDICLLLPLGSFLRMIPKHVQGRLQFS